MGSVQNRLVVLHVALPSCHHGVVGELLHNYGSSEGGMAFSATLSTWETEKSIHIGVALTLPVHCIKLKLLQSLESLCKLTLRLLEVAQPGQRTMICM